MNNIFSENLKKIRKDNNMSQEQLAEELGVSRQAISKWESAVAYPEMDKIIMISEKFNLNIDDLLHKDIREIKGEEETKLKLNKYVDDFLNFITNTINMFSNMSFKSKIKCLFEQCVIAFILFIVSSFIFFFGGDLLSGMFRFIPATIYEILSSIISTIFIAFAIFVSLMILVHIFKTRYLDYYEKIKKETIDEDYNDCESITEANDKDNISKSNNKEIDRVNKILFKKNENKIIIRDPKHSEYKFLNAISKIIIGIIKFFTLCFATLFFMALIFFMFGFIVSFLVYKTGLVFIGLLILFLSLAIIDIDFILLILNFVFNRKNDKKKIIWSFVISLVCVGIGTGFISMGILNFEYIENDKNILKTDYIEIDMKDNLFFYTYYESIDFIESDINNIKIEYTINKYCNANIHYSNSYNSDDLSGIHIWSYCDNPIKLMNEFIKSFNNKKITSVNNDLSISVYASKENIEKLKSNLKLYMDKTQAREVLENKIDELEEKIEEKDLKIIEYEDEINELKSQLSAYEYYE